jgi:hypothetical protein
MKLFEHNIVIKEMVNHVNYLLTLTEDDDEEKKKKEQKRIKNLDDKIHDLNVRLNKLDAISKAPAKKVKIKFFSETKLSVRSGSDKTERTLRGDMYFDVVGSGSGYLDLQTRNITKGVAIRLHYSKLEPLLEQHGKVELVYNSKENFSDIERRSKDTTDIMFKFNKIEK